MGVRFFSDLGVGVVIFSEGGAMGREGGAKFKGNPNRQNSKNDPQGGEKGTKRWLKECTLTWFAVRDGDTRRGSNPHRALRGKGG